jgi:hypothetical protein
LLTIAAHEIRHALGLDSKNTALSRFAPNGLTLRVTDPRLFAGSTIRRALNHPSAVGCSGGRTQGGDLPLPARQNGIRLVQGEGDPARDHGVVPLADGLRVGEINMAAKAEVLSALRAETPS